MTRRVGADLLVITALSLVATAGCSAPDAAGPKAGSEGVVPVAAWTLDGDGNSAAGAAPLTFTGGHEFTDEAVSLDGASGAGATASPGPVDTQDSFTVAAWVHLGSPALGGDSFPAAVSQLGEEAAAFYLGVAGGEWAFSMKDADTNEPGHTVRATSPRGAETSERWVHLAGVHDAERGSLVLLVDGTIVAETAFGEPWPASGPLTVGRSQAHGTAADFWPGAVADVQVFDRPLGSGDVDAIMGAARPAAEPPARPVLPPSAWPDGRYDYTYTAEEAAEVVELGFSPEEAAAAGYPATVTGSLRFVSGLWQLFFSFDGVPYEVDGVPEGDGGTFTVDGDRLTTSNGSIDVVYRWSFDGEVLSLTLLEDSAGPDDAAVTRLITEHAFTRGGD
jgi:hypothetical protein